MSSVPVHYQIEGRTAAEIAARVEAGIRAGALPPGQALPPVRTLATDLAVSPATVAAAYRALRQRGFVETAGRNGTRVRQRPAVTAPQRSAARLVVPPGTVDLSSGRPDERLLPIPGPVTVRPENYRDQGVLPELLELARERLDRDGVPTGALTLTGGALDGIERVLGAHLIPGDRVAVEDPGWANLLDLVAALGLDAVPVPVDPAGPTPEGLRAALAAGVRAVVVTSRAQNPTGATTTRTRATALRAVLRRRPDVVLIEDDHAAELATRPLYPLAGVTRHWAFLRSTSKPYGPDLRLAVLAADDVTASRVAGRMRLGTGWVSTVLQRVVIALWTDRGVAAQLDLARNSYRDRREALLGALAARGLTATGPTGINVWVPVPDETTAVAALREHGYLVAPGARFRIATPPAVRITVSQLDPDHVGPLADAVAAALAPAGGYAV